MTPRVWMMREMLKPGASSQFASITEKLFRLGMLLDEVFVKKTDLPLSIGRNPQPSIRYVHCSTSTEYVLVYAKDLAKARTGSIRRSSKITVAIPIQTTIPTVTGVKATPRRGPIPQNPTCNPISIYGRVALPTGSRVWSHPKEIFLNGLRNGALNTRSEKLEMGKYKL